MAVIAHQILPPGIIGRRGDGFGIIAAGDIGDKMQMDGGVHADALHLCQLLRAGIENTDKRAELFDQTMGQHVGIPPGNGIKKQKLQNIMWSKAVQTLREVTLPQAVTVTGMFIGHTAVPLPF